MTAYPLKALCWASRSSMENAIRIYIYIHIYIYIYIYRYVRHTLVAQSRVDVMWEELSVAISKTQ